MLGPVGECWGGAAYLALESLLLGRTAAQLAESGLRESRLAFLPCASSGSGLRVGWEPRRPAPGQQGSSMAVDWRVSRGYLPSLVDGRRSGDA